MKRIILLSLLAILIILIVACSPTTDSQRQAKNLSEFIIGRWYGEFHQTNGNTNPVRYELQFIRPNLMFYSRTSSEVELHNVLFHYEFSGENRIRLESRAIDEITVTRDGEYLVIDSLHNLIHDGRYARLPIIDSWALFTLMLGILSLLTIFVKPLGSQKKLQERLITGSEARSKVLMHFVLHNALMISAFGLGAIIAREVWNLLWQFLVNVPWDTIIMIELSIAMLILGIKGIKVKRVELVEPFFSVTRWLNYFGIFLLGSGIWGISIGFIRLIILFNVGSYSPF